MRPNRTGTRERKLALLLLRSERIAAFNETFGWKVGALEEYVRDVDRYREYPKYLERVEKNKFSPLDLSGVNLAGLNLAGVKLAGANLSRANLEGTNLVGADLREVRFDGASLKGAILADACLTSAVHVSRLFWEDQRKEYRPGANFTNADLSGPGKKLPPE